MYVVGITDEWVVPDRIYNLIDGTDEERKVAKDFLESIQFDYDYDPRLRSALSLVGFLERVK